jgi:tetratricopeptide (TPR) repeat protein
MTRDLILASAAVSIAVANDGAARRRWLAERLAAASADGARTSLLPCDFALGGPWAGVAELLAEILPDLRAGAPELVSRHDYEILNVLPALRRELRIRNPNLTDVAADSERVRNYPSDRALRIVHGLIDLTAAWKERFEPRPWVVVCDRFDHGAELSRTFFRELVRRRGEALSLTLVVAVDPAIDPLAAGESAEGFAATPVSTVRLDLPPDPPGVSDAAADAAADARAAEELERRVDGDPIETEAHLPELIRLWREADRPERAFHWQSEALSTYNSLGFYADAVRYGDAALAGAKLYAPDDMELRWTIFIKLFMCHVALGNVEVAYRLAEDEALGKTEDPGALCRLYYLVAMLHARYLPQRDLAKAEEYLNLGLEALSRWEVPESDVHFQTVFNRNGLAMIRHFQGRFDEAIELCREGYLRLQKFLQPGTHRLHRSVLLYNTAQVYQAIGSFDEAIAHFTAAMELDPNYSEYFNERGNIHLKLGRWREARADYLQAIELSPPYHEVWTNLGQCHRLLGEPEESVAAYSRALDLQPGNLLPLVGRAQAHEMLGQRDPAIADYSAALAIDPAQPEILGNRAALHYEAGDLAACVADLDRAVAVAPRLPDLYQNRALVLADLGRLTEAAADLETALALDPETPEREEIERRIVALRSPSTTSSTISDTISERIA